MKTVTDEIRKEIEGLDQHAMEWPARAVEAGKVLMQDFDAVVILATKRQENGVSTTYRVTSGEWGANLDAWMDRLRTESLEGKVWTMSHDRKG